jgi:hypothetical protein
MDDHKRNVTMSVVATPIAAMVAWALLVAVSQLGADPSATRAAPASQQTTQPDRSALNQKLLAAAKEGNYREVRSLLEAGADANVRVNGESPLKQAVARDHVEVVGFLLMAGADVNQVGDYGVTPLHMAAMGNQVGMGGFLIKRGANIEAQAARLCGGNSRPLHVAAVQGNAAFALLLLDKGADVNARERNDQTALHVAATHGYVGTVRFLLESKADPTLKDNAGMTALDYARRNGHEKVVQLLTQPPASQPTTNPSTRADG